MKKLLSTTLTLLLVIGLGTSTLKAEDKTKPKHDAETGVIVTFEDKIDVIDPDNPDTNPEVVDPGKDSSIQIWKVPKNLKFKAKRSNKNQVVGLTEGDAHTYGVFDFHSESPDWQLFAKLSKLEEESGAREENLDNLKGASLQWKSDNIKRVTINSDNNPHKEVAPYVTGLKEVKLVAEEEAAVNLMHTDTYGVQTGNKGHFEGTMEDLGLVIPAFQGNPNTTYNGKITWTLQSPVFAKGE